MWKSVQFGTRAALLIVAVFAGTGCGNQSGAGPSNPTVKSPARHERYIAGLSQTYAGKTNPLKTTIGNVVEGARLYDLRCAVCHGMMGIGDGEAGERLDTPPADLGRSLGERAYGDDFFYWSIAEGGGEFGTDMPPFKNDLSDREIWKVLTFMRAAFAEHADPAATDAVAPP